MPKVLIIDDDQDSLELLDKLLASKEYQVITARDGLSGLELAKLEKPELVILDVLLPKLNGFEVCAKLKGDPDTFNIPIIMLSAVYISDDDIKRGLQLGASHYLVKSDLVVNKPFLAKELLINIENLLLKRKPAPIKPKILVVDDNRDNVEILVKRLRNDGYEVLAGFNGQEGLDLAKEHLPSLILLDIQMPELDGIGALKRIKRAQPDIAVVMMTAFGSEDIAVEAMKLGADDYIKKPLDYQEISAKVSENLEKNCLKVENRKLVGHLEESNKNLIQRYEKLEKAMEEIATWNRELESKVEEKTVALKEAHQKLEKTYNRLQVFDQIKTDFLSLVSHELKTPLTVIKGYLTMLEIGKLGDVQPSQLELIKVAGKNAIRLQEKIDDLVELSQIEIDGKNLDIEPFAIGPLIDELKEFFKQELKLKNISLQIEIPSNLPKVMADRNGIHKVLRNLLSNACKFSQQGTITIKAQRIDSGVNISISDEGVGVEKDALDFIFERFYQANSSTSRQHGGIGLGLAIVKSILDAHHVPINVESTVGQGATFGFILPMDK